MALRELEEAIRTLQKRQNELQRALTSFSPEPLPEPIYSSGASVNTVTASGGSWVNLGPSSSLRITLTPTAPMVVEVIANAICKASSGYTMISVNVSGGVTLAPDELPGGASGAAASPFTSSSVDTGLMMPPKMLTLPAGVPTTFDMYARRNVSSGSHYVNYPVIAVLPVRWA